jgi:hypothetical protein
MRSADCETHSWRVAAFQVLPPIYPSGQKWSAEDNARYTPITQDIVDGVTHELTPKDIEQSLSWITQSMCIVTSNVYRAIINATAARALGKLQNVHVLRWKCQMRQKFPRLAKIILCDKNERPELLAYFAQGASGQVLDNAHGNVYFGVTNGTPCTMHSLAWDDSDSDDERTALETIAKSTPGKVVDLPMPPAHIIIDIMPQPGSQ